MVFAGRRMYDSGLVTGALGSIGVRLANGQIVVTAAGARIGFLETEQFLLLDEYGKHKGGEELMGQEAGMLFAALSAVPQTGAVIRVHPPYTTALAHQGRRRVEKAEALMEHLGGVAFVPYYRPGTSGLAGAVEDALRQSQVAIIESQGPVVRGADIDEAVDRAEALETAAKVVFLLGNGNGNGNGAGRGRR